MRDIAQSIRAVKLTFRQTGGFVGIDRGVALETTSLPNGLRTAAESLLKSDAPIATSSPAARDQMQYYVQIEGDDDRRELRFDDETMPEKLSDLVNHLRSQSRPLPPQRGE